MNKKKVLDSTFTQEWEERPTRKKYREFLRPRAKETVEAVSLSHALLIANTHFHDSKTYQCHGNPRECHWCKLGQRVRRKGYLCGFSVSSRRQVLIEITEGAMMNNAAIRDPKYDKRGKLVTLIRAGDSKNSPVKVVLGECNNPTIMRALPEPFDMISQLIDMWELMPAVMDFGDGVSHINDLGKTFTQECELDIPY